jgi:murein DD-endopeptidase MepM/ murein hydrolase activator NlpD
MFMSFGSFARESGKISWAGALSGLIGIAQPSVAFGNPVTSDEEHATTAAPRGAEFVGSARVLQVGAGSAQLMAMSGSAPLAIGRAADLEGRPLVLVVKPGARSRLGGGIASVGNAKQDLLQPVANRRVTSGYGARWDPLGAGWRTHSGIDLAAAYGSPVVASGNGTVAVAGWQGGYGLLVQLDHGGGLETRYGHLSRLSVQPGQQVRKGEVVGFVGSTGRSTGPHLHYEIRENGRAIDPAAVTRR